MKPYRLTTALASVVSSYDFCEPLHPPGFRENTQQKLDNGVDSSYLFNVILTVQFSLF